MSEHVASPFTGYNLEGPPKVLTGNFFEERALLAATGAARRRPAADAAVAGDASSCGTDSSPRGALHGSSGGGGSIFPSPADKAANAAQPATFRRVVEHSEREQDPKAWQSATHAAHAPPAKLRGALAGTYQGPPAAGPREARELRRLREEAVAAAASEAAAAEGAAAEAVARVRFGTAYADTFMAPPLEGLTLGARVMKTRDGGPVARDPEFLVEAGLLDRATAGRVFRRQDAIRRRTAAPGGEGECGEGAAGSAASGLSSGGGWGGAAAAAAPAEADEPVTIYSHQPGGSLPGGGGGGAEGGGGACALTRSFHGTGGPKSRHMARNDQFTKLPGDPNKRPE
ncbi:MAG: hypothetical protein J3K34DRAFT_492148 [Monoraphidium minutum]|nr:MAG: hypothetical protein J3K34DRAFT_492148 [Monoraphidium minutum]